ncbi:hypothetical protein [Luethyella okanaganae]|uniref:Uncharacterized protein n=1 Tax=Luethyella okanaganae TaxID=69372 RepID=A0ABW1VC07_9MICO
MTDPTALVPLSFGYSFDTEDARRLRLLDEGGAEVAIVESRRSGEKANWPPISKATAFQADTVAVTLSTGERFEFVNGGKAPCRRRDAGASWVLLDRSYDVVHTSSRRAELRRDGAVIATAHSSSRRTGPVQTTVEAECDIADRVGLALLERVIHPGRQMLLIAALDMLAMAG